MRFASRLAAAKQEGNDVMELKKMILAAGLALAVPTVAVAEGPREDRRDDREEDRRDDREEDKRDDRARDRRGDRGR